MKKMVICAPITSRSGYGEHARDLVKSFIEHEKYEIQIIDVRWGDCPRNALDVNNKSHQMMKSLIVPPNHQFKYQPDVYVDIRIPNEFQTWGKFNIGITAGVETDAVSPAFLEGCNKMDLIIVPSEHSKKGFADSVYDKMKDTPNGKQKDGELKLEKPMEVLFEGADEEIYKPLNTKEIDSEFFDWLNEEVPEKFAFLVVGQWTQGNFGEDRKDLGTTVKLFYEAFANKKKQPALIMKTNGATYSVMDREQCKQKIDDIKKLFPKDWKLPNIYILHGDLTPTEMNYLYNHPKVKSMISFTHGEGFGRPLLEATMTGLPVMVSDWSGHKDFLNPELTLMLPGTLNNIPPSMVWKDILIKESKWFYIDGNGAYKSLNYLYENIDLMKTKSKEQMKNNRENFTLNSMTNKLDEIVTPFIEKIPTSVELKLPKLKKVGDKPTSTGIPKIKLPKLKKVEKMQTEGA